MTNLRTSSFSSITEYLKDLRKLEKFTNYTMKESEHLLSREVFENFLNGLSPYLSHTASLFGSFDLEDLAIKLDNSVFISKNLKRNFINNRDNKIFRNLDYKNNFNSRNIDKGCNCHRTPYHSNKECRNQNNYNKHECRSMGAVPSSRMVTV